MLGLCPFINRVLHDFRKIAKGYDTIFWTLNPKSQDSNLRLGGYRIRVIKGNFFKNTSKLSKLLEDRVDPQLDLPNQIKLRLGGYSIWSASTSRTIYQDRFGA